MRSTMLQAKQGVMTLTLHVILQRNYSTGSPELDGSSYLGTTIIYWSTEPSAAQVSSPAPPSLRQQPYL
jgi:hypothetical protein